MLTSDDKKHLVDDLLGIRSDGLRDTEGKLTADARLAEYLFLVVSACGMFPDLFYGFSAKLLGSIQQRLLSVTQSCDLIRIDLAAMYNDRNSPIDVQPLQTAVQTLKMMAATVPSQGDPAYRKYQRSLALFRTSNREYFQDDGSGGIAVTAEEAFDSLKQHVEELRTTTTLLLSECSWLLAGGEEFDSLAWSNRLAAWTSRKSQGLVASSWADLLKYGKRKITDAIYTIVASETVLSQLLETGKSRVEDKWSGTAVPVAPFSLPEMIGTQEAPFYPAIGETLEYSINGTSYSVDLNPFSAAIPEHLFLPLPDGEVEYTIVAGNDVLYITSSLGDHRFPAAPGVLAPGSYSPAAMSAALLSGTAGWGTIILPNIGLLLYPSAPSGTTLSVAVGYETGGVYEGQTAHVALGVTAGEVLNSYISLEEAKSLYSSPGLGFYYNPGTDSDFVRLCAENPGEVTDEDYVEVLSDCAALGFLSAEALPTSDKVSMSDSLGRPLVGDSLEVGASLYTVLAVSSTELQISAPVASGIHSAVLRAPEVALFPSVEESIRTFLSDTSDLGVAGNSLGSLDQLGVELPKPATRQTLTSLVDSLYDLCILLRASLASYPLRRDPICEDLLSSLTTAGYQRAASLLAECRFQDFISVSPSSASSVGGVIKAAQEVGTTYTPKSSIPALSLPDPVVRGGG